jgi:hypothetical protein
MEQEQNKSFVTCEDCKYHRKRIWDTIDKQGESIEELEKKGLLLEERLSTMQKDLGRINKGIWWVLATVGGILITAIINLIIN